MVHVRSALIVGLTIAGLATPVTLPALAQSAPAPAAATAPAAPVPLTVEDAKSLLGDWTIGIQTEQGPSTMNLTLKAEQGKPVGEISSDMMAATPVTDITKAGDTIVLRYSFDYQGNMVPTVVTLKPIAGEKLDVFFDFAGGAFTLPGTATRKKN